MCGIAGVLTTLSTSEPIHVLASRMLPCINHRGPDSEGIWTDPARGLCLAHKRLAIVDLSPNGHQPMLSASGRYVIVFNGEIYNFADLKQECPEYPYRGGSDTEVMLAAFEKFGVEAATPKFNGMFAFAVWDKEERTVTLGRDRFGVKPLYYLIGNGLVAWSSELKSLLAYPEWQPEIDRDSLSDYMQYAYIPAPYSIYKGVYKLVQGTTLQFKEEELPSVLSSFSAHPGRGKVSPKVYWSAKEARTRGLEQPFRGTESEALNHLDGIIADSIRLRMIADVPLGAFLSGGTDSSIVVAEMQRQSSRPVKTFTIGFTDESYNEADYAREVASVLGTDHTELLFTPEEAQSIIPKIPQMYDEPLGDVSQIPTYLVSKLAKGSVTVALSGDGGDEFFGGYNRYLWAEKLWGFFSKLPTFGRKKVASGILSLSPHSIERAYGIAKPLLPDSLFFHNPSAKIRKFATFMNVEDHQELYERLLTFWDGSDIVKGASRRPPLSFGLRDDRIHSMMLHDALTYLPDQIMVKVDRATMAVSLEAREPLLDYRIFEFACSLPLDYKVRNGKGKWILKELLKRHIPDRLVERPKMGFSVPIGDWLRGPLKEWADALLDPSRLNREGYLEASSIRHRWMEHCEGKHNHEGTLWTALMFQSWLEEYRGVLEEPSNEMVKVRDQIEDGVLVEAS